jgi:hypothetical protein
MDQPNEGAHPTQAELVSVSVSVSASVSPTRKQMHCHAVQKCCSLEGPVIFWNWQDCKLTLCGSEKEDNLEHRSFARIPDAANYVAFQQVINSKIGTMYPEAANNALWNGQHPLPPSEGARHRYPTLELDVFEKSFQPLSEHIHACGATTLILSC